MQISVIVKFNICGLFFPLGSIWFQYQIPFLTLSKFFNFQFPTSPKISQAVDGVQCFRGAATDLPTITAVTASATEQISQINEPLRKDSPRALCYCFSLPPLLFTAIV